jgi:hypothetical protein
MRESYIEKQVVDYAKSRGWFVRKLQWIGVDGAPDRIFIKDGVVVFIEFKAPGKKPKLRQEQEAEIIRYHGVGVYVVDAIGYGKSVLDLHEK